MTSVLSPHGAATATPPQVPSLSSSHPFTCNTCQVAFRSSEQQRTHMHTDWHRYNLKRRITSLPPLTSEVFAEKVLHIQVTNRLEREKAEFERTCEACNKTYYSENAYSNHVNSSKHRQAVAAQKLGISTRKEEAEKDEIGSVISSTFSLGTALDEDGGTAATRGDNGVSVIIEETEKERAAADKEFAEVIAGLKISSIVEATTSKKTVTNKQVHETKKESIEESQPLSLETCLFCTYVSPTLLLNVSHMSKAHGLFIPEAQYLVDIPGLIKYLGEKVALLNECLYCGKVKGGLEGVRTHMRDLGHCKIAYETEEDQLEIGEFYDFRSTYEGVPESDDEEDEGYIPKKGIRPRRSRDESAEFKTEDGITVGNDDVGWETDSSASSLDSTELCAVPLEHGHHSTSSQEGSHSGHAKHHKEDGWHSRAHKHAHTTAIYHTDYELHLPSGRSVGHRSLARYYRQNLSHPLSERAARKERAIALRLREARGSDGSSDAEEVDEFDPDAEVIVDEEQPRSAGVGVSRELTRRERRNLFFGRMGQEEREAIVGRVRGSERGLSREVGLEGVSIQRRGELRLAEKRNRRIEGRESRRIQWLVNKQSNHQKHYRELKLQ